MPSIAGNSNDGNTARKFFANPEIVAEATGVDQSLIERLGTLGQALSCRYEIDAQKFDAFSRATYDLYVGHATTWRQPSTKFSYTAWI